MTERVSNIDTAAHAWKPCKTTHPPSSRHSALFNSPPPVVGLLVRFRSRSFMSCSPKRRAARCCN